MRIDEVVAVWRRDTVVHRIREYLSSGVVTTSTAVTNSDLRGMDMRPSRLSDSQVGHVSFSPLHTG